MANPVKQFRGPKADIPTLEQGRLGYCTDTDEVYIGDGTTNHLVGPMTIVRYITIRLLDLTTKHEVDTSVGGDFRVPEAMTVSAVGAYFDTAGTGSVTTIDINEGDTSILSTKITVDAGEKSSETAETAPVISDSSIAADAVLTFDVDAVASGTAGKGLTVWLKVVLNG